MLGTADDTFSAGVISSLVLGTVTTATVAAGPVPLAGGTILGTLQLLPKGAIRSVSVKNTLSDDSRILAASLPKTVRVGKTSVATATDPRFNV